MKDGRDLEVSCASAQAIAALDHLREQWLSYGNELGRLFDALPADPDCPMLQLMAALLHLSMETRQGYADAAPHLEAARRLAGRMNDRERAWLAELEAQAADDMARVVAIHEEMAERWPADILAAKIGQKHYFYIGDMEGMLRLSDRTLHANRDVSHAHGMRAFALEQCHRLGEAEEAGRRAVELNRDDPWAHHAVAHVMETQGRLDEGLAWMRGLSDSWARCNSFMYTHNWWHTALFHIDRDETAEALALFDGRVWGVWKEFSQDQVNAISLLLRLELRGVDVGARWQDVAAYLKGRTEEHVSPFLDLHYIYGLARGGERHLVTEMLASMESHAEEAPPFVHHTWQAAAIPAAYGMVAHARGDWTTAVDELARALPHLQGIGGSHAQRDLFEQVYLDALLRAGWNDRALALLKQRDRNRDRVPAIKRDLAEVSQRLGHAEAAARYAANANDLSRRYGGA